MHSSSIVQANNSRQSLIETCQLGKFCGKTVDYKKKWESFYIALAIIGLCILATGVGLGISGVVPISSLAFMSFVGIGAASIAIGISGKLVSCIKKRTLSSNDNTSESKETPQIPNIEANREEEVSNQITELEDGWISEANQILLRSMRLLVNLSDNHSIEVKIEKDSFLFYSRNNEDLGTNIYFIRKTDQDLNEELIQISFINNEIKEILYKENKIEKFSEIPSIYINALEIPYINFLKQNTKYSFDPYLINIEIFRPGIQIIPAYHLEHFTDSLSLDCTLKVKFIFDEELITNNGEAIDCGGPARDFLNDLVKSLYTKEAFVFRKLKDYCLYIPTIQREDLSKANTIKDIPLLTEDEEKIFQQLGKVFMFAFQFDRFTTGYYLDPATFYAIHILTSSEIDQPFAQLSNETKLKMCKAIAQVHNHKAFELICDLLLTQEAKKKPNLEDLRIGAQILLDMEEINENELEELMKKENHSNLLNKLLALLLTENTSMGVLNARLAPIHAIAKGMKSLGKNLNWKNTISQVSPYELNLKIQGNINRQAIVDSIQLSSLKYLNKDRAEEIRKKTGWLTNWILNSATDQETKAILKFLTGSSSLASGIQIIVCVQDKNYLPVMKADSCFYKFYLSPVPASYGEYNDSTEEAFIRALKDLVLKNPGDYSE